jgi:hypothetical protein
VNCVAARWWNNCILHCCVAKWHNYVGDSLAVSYKAKNRTTPAITLLDIYPNDVKMYVHTKVCTSIYISFIHNCQTWKYPRHFSIVALNYSKPHDRMKGNQLSRHAKV